MSIPRVNAGVTDRNREQTKRICELKGWKYDTTERYEHPKNWACAALGDWDDWRDLPEGSFTLDQVVQMLKEKDVIYATHIWRFLDCSGWGLLAGCVCKVLSHNVVNPHDLTDAMDALIKLEEKHG